MAGELPFSQSRLPRPKLLASIMAHRNTPDIKVITGVRRCGKSTLMAMVVDELLQQGIPASNIFYKKLDSFDIPLNYDANALYEELAVEQKNLDVDHPWYVFLDEIQDVDGWERVVRRLHSRPCTDVYLTGSNSQLLSSDLATYLTGRYIEISAFPLSYAEYLAFSETTGSRASEDSSFTQSEDELLANYLLYGGMPGLFALSTRNPSTIADELSGIYQSILLKDVAQRFGIRDLEGLNRLGRFTFANAGMLFSTRNIANSLKSGGHNSSETAVSNQLRALERAFLVYPAEQLGIQGKDVLRPQKKYYPVDLGFVGLTHGFSGRNLGARLECAVALELLRRGWDISIGTGQSNEIDFVARKPANADRMYVQVSVDIRNEATRERELKPLRALTDSFPRLLITLDRYSEGTTPEGIRIVHAARWLTDGQ